jgi:hypothetical protein
MTDKITLIDFLKKNIISIPKIQRDYIQGQNSPRNNAVREEFLKDIKQKFDDDSEMNMDFIYGTLNKGIFTPLDGQQRLTTLFLLHWFALNYKDNADSKKHLKNFSFEVRDYSKEFVQKLTETDIAKNEQISIIIENQPWFLNYWKKDTTVSSMLNMLDDIQKEFGDSNFAKLSEWLLNKVTFYKLELNEFELGDELYIRMNARGKSLSDYENFKSWLDENIPYDKKLKWSEKLDSDWTNLIWAYDDGDCNIDNEMMLLFRSLIIFHLKEFQKNPNDLDNDYKLLHGQKENGSGEKTFISLKQYETFIGSEINDFIENTSNFLDCFYKNKSEIEKLCKDVNLWDANCNPFKSLLHNNTLKNKVLFYALYAYIIKHKEEDFNDNNNFKRYLRIIRNLVEYTNIGFADLNKYFKSINYLAQLNDVFSDFDTNEISGFDGPQVKEEKEKIDAITTKKVSEEIIIKAENNEFLKGRVCFLLHSSNNDIEFTNLFKKIEYYFDTNGVKEEFRENAIFLRNLISKFTYWNQFKEFCYSNKSNHWKENFSNIKKDILFQPIKETLESELDYNLSSISSEIKFDDYDENYNDMRMNCREELLKTDLLAHIEADCFLKYNEELDYYLMPYNAKADWKKYLISNKRNDIIRNLIKNNNITIAYGKINNTNNFFCGTYIGFKDDKQDYFIDASNEIFTTSDKENVTETFKL